MPFITDPLEANFFVRALLGGSLAAVLCACVGTWVVLRGMAFLGEALAHGILPGVAVSVLLGFPPVAGAAVSAAAMALGVRTLTKRTRLSNDTAIGILFVGMLALGIAIVSKSGSFAVDVTAMLFGDVLAIGPSELWLIGGALALAAVGLARYHRPFTALALDPRKAHTLGLRPEHAGFALIALVAVAAIASYQAIGTLLVTALLLAPPAAASLTRKSVAGIMTLGSTIGVGAVVVGLYTSWHFAIAAGPAIALAAVCSVAIAAALTQISSRIRKRHVLPRARLAPPSLPASATRQPVAPGKRMVFATLAAFGMLAMAGCAPLAPAGSASNPEGSSTSPSTSGQDEAEGEGEQPHGFVEGAQELAEAQASVVSIGADGGVTVLNLLNGETATLNKIPTPTWAVSDGRFVFAGSASGDGEGTTQVVDSGVWTVPHGDHVHYYKAEPRIAGELRDAGPATASSNEEVAALSFATSGSTVVLDRQALGQGELVELLRLESAPHEAAAAPVGTSIVASTVASAGAVPQLASYTLDGTKLGEGLECPGLSDVQPTSLGATFACDDGLVFASAAEATTAATGSEAAPTLTKVPYPAAGDPAGAAPGAATSLDNRPHRPAVAGPAGDAGIWLASSRSQEIRFIPTEQPILTAVAVGDDESRVVAVDARGTLLVFDGASGEVTGSQAGLIGVPESAAGIHLAVDTSRAYLSAPSSTELHEIDYKDGARVARTLTLPSAPVFAFETGN